MTAWKNRSLAIALLIGAIIGVPFAHVSWAEDKKPNIVLIVSDDFGYGDAGVYGGGPGRGMPTLNIDRLADEGMTFFSFYAQPSCTAAVGVATGLHRSPAGRTAHLPKGRISNEERGSLALPARKSVSETGVNIQRVPIPRLSSKLRRLLAPSCTIFRRKCVLGHARKTS
jgi:hypothetical protein